MLQLQAVWHSDDASIKRNCACTWLHCTLSCLPGVSPKVSCSADSATSLHCSCSWYLLRHASASCRAFRAQVLTHIATKHQRLLLLLEATLHVLVASSCASPADNTVDCCQQERSEVHACSWPTPAACNLHHDSYWLKQGESCRNTA